ncbi:MAG: leucine-rich repeat domain-containing protein [Clostridia bacterium]|nr:leucine-rich repeat domain-containing protein [Clostridia bacterium]
MKKKIIIAFILVACVLCATVAISACTGIMNNFVIEDNTIVNLTYYGRRLDHINIPDGITGIGDEAFSYSSMSSVNIPSSVTNINPRAFINCKNLTRITVDRENTVYASDGNCIIDKKTNKVIVGCKGSVIPNYATGIGEYAFYTCGELTSIEIPEGVTEIGRFAFAECNKLKSIDISEGVTKIDSIAFYRCKELTSIEIPESVTEIGRFAFAECHKLTGIKIPERVTSIDEYVFYRCNSLTSIDIHDGVTEIGKYAFAECDKLTSIDIPEGVTDIGEYAFYYCTGLTDVILPSTIDQIANGTFNFCKELPSISIPQSVTRIGSKAFDSCRCLTSIDIPLSVTQIEDKAFDDCSSLVIRYQGATKPEGWGSSRSTDEVEVPVILNCNNNEVANDGYIYTLSDNGLVYALKDGVAILKGHGRVKGDIVIDSAVEYKGQTYQVKEIGGSAFYHCNNIVSVVIPEGITKIGNSAFLGSSITSVELPNSLEQIGYMAFALCMELKSVYIPASVQQIGIGAFWSTIENIYCQATEEPEGWDRWYIGDGETKVEWGYNPD